MVESRPSRSRITPISRAILCPILPAECPQLRGRVGLWVHADDLCLESSPIVSSQPAAVAAFTSDDTDARDGLSQMRIAAIHRALRDGLTRAGAHLGRETTLSDTFSTADGVKAWVEREKLDAVIAMSPHIGPVADALPPIRRALSNRNVPLHLVRRPWDAQLFPLATSGFFPF